LVDHPEAVAKADYEHSKDQDEFFNVSHYFVKSINDLSKILIEFQKSK